MTTDLWTLIRLALILTIVVYFVFDFLDRKRVQDEREELIRLKSLELTHRVNLVCVTALAVLVLMATALNAVVPIAVFILSSMVTEMVGKLWYRRRL